MRRYSLAHAINNINFLSLTKFVLYSISSIWIKYVERITHDLWEKDCQNLIQLRVSKKSERKK